MLNHTLLTVRAIEAVELECVGVIVNPLPDGPSVAALRNVEQLEACLGADRVWRAS